MQKLCINHDYARYTKLSNLKNYAKICTQKIMQNYAYVCKLHNLHYYAPPILLMLNVRPMPRRARRGLRLVRVLRLNLNVKLSGPWPRRVRQPEQPPVLRQTQKIMPRDSRRDRDGRPSRSAGGPCMPGLGRGAARSGPCRDGQELQLSRSSTRSSKQCRY